MTTQPDDDDPTTGVPDSGYEPEDYPDPDPEEGA